MNDMAVLRHFDTAAASVRPQPLEGDTFEAWHASGIPIDVAAATTLEEAVYIAAPQSGRAEPVGQAADQGRQVAPAQGLPDAVLLLAQRGRVGARFRVLEQQAREGRLHRAFPEHGEP